MKQIALTQDKVALVDDDDYERINVYKWQAVRSRPRVKHCDLWRAASWGLSGGEKKRATYMHHMALPVMRGFQVDHINHDSLDNRRSNLRYVTASGNLANSRQRKDTLSGLRGAYFDKVSGIWKASIKQGGKLRHIGVFGSAQEAHDAFVSRHLELYGTVSVFHEGGGL